MNTTTAGIMSALLIGMMAVGGAHAQTVRGVVTNAVNGAIIPSALVSASDERGGVVAPQLASAAGRFALVIFPNRATTVLVRSIGMLPVRIELPPLAVGADTTLTVQMNPVVAILQTVQVEGYSTCTRDQTGTRGAADVWTQVTTSLESAMLANRTLVREFAWVLHQSELDVYTGLYSMRRADTSASIAARPFTTATARDLFSNGYILESRRDMLFRAPDESVLQDERFLSTHCFWITGRGTDGPDEVGLSFMPMDAVRVNEIRGTFWIDRTTGELRSLEFNYARRMSSRARAVAAESNVAWLDRELARMDSVLPGISKAEAVPGGELSFRRLIDGTLIIDRWRMWTTNNWTREDPRGESLPQPRIRREVSGEVIRIGAVRSDTLRT